MSVKEILIIENEAPFRNLIKRALKGEGYSFVEAGSVREGTNKLNEHPNIKLILLDLELPDGSGRDILEKIKENASNYRVIVLTAHDEYLAADKARDYSVFDYLIKPNGSFTQSIRFKVDKAFTDIEKSHRIVNIFISYTHTDFEKVSIIYHRLKDKNFDPWIDKKDIRIGDRWNEKIEEAINNCDFFLCCISDNALRSRYFKNEMKSAIKRYDTMKGEPLILPLILGNCKVPTGFIKRKIHYIAYEPHHDDWWEELFATLRSKG